jgi:hypothetical protein
MKEKMRKIAILVLILSLAFPAAAGAKHYGPPWAVWTHSEDPDECAIKTAFWAAVIVAGVCYVGSKLTAEGKPPNAKFIIEPAVWMESRGEITPAIGFRIRW